VLLHPNSSEEWSFIAVLDAWTVFKEMLCEPGDDPTQYKNQSCMGFVKLTTLFDQ